MPLRMNQLAILQMLADGKTCKEIAGQLGTTHQVVKNMLCDLRKIFEVRTTVQLISTVLRRGIID